MKVILFSFPTSKVGISTEAWGGREEGSLLWRLPAVRTSCTVAEVETVFKWDDNKETSCTPVREKSRTWVLAHCCLQTWYCFLPLPSFVFVQPSFWETLKIKYTSEVLSGVEEIRVQAKVFCWSFVFQFDQATVMHSIFMNERPTWAVSFLPDITLTCREALDCT